MEAVHLPESWGKWNIDELLGTGADGKVYSAHSTAGEQCAIKIVEIAVRKNTEEEYRQVYEKIKRQMLIRKELSDSDYIVRMDEYAIERCSEQSLYRVYLKLELLTSIADYMQEHSMSEEEAAVLAINICEALKFCEEKKVLHHDIKTENIMVTEDGRYKLGDFGIAEYSYDKNRSHYHGTFSYMAPEVYHGERGDARSDQYSLGIVLYRILNRNRDPFVDTEKQLVYYKDREDALMHRMSGETLPDPCNASETFTKIIKKAAAFDPKERFASAAEMKKYLIRFQNGENIERIPGKKKKMLWAGGICAAAAILVIMGIFISRFFTGSENDDMKLTRSFTETEQRIAQQGVKLNDASEYCDTPGALYFDKINESEDALKLSEMAKKAFAKKQESDDQKEEYDVVESSLIYLEDSTAIVQVIGYSVVSNPETDRKFLNPDIVYEYYAYSKNNNDTSEWNEIKRDDIPKDLWNSIFEIYLPEECLEAREEGGNYEYYDGLFYSGSESVFEDLIDLDVSVVWQNEDGSVDAMLSVRNGSEDATILQYLLELDDSGLGCVLQVNAENCNLKAKAGKNYSVKVHFDKEDVLTGEKTWTKLVKTISEYNSDSGW